MSRDVRRITVPEFSAMKAAGRKITVLTAYDHNLASHLDETEIEGIVGETTIRSGAMP